jgi:hypothetical protein
VINNLVSRPIEARPKCNFGNGHAHAVRKTLAQRPCGSLDAGGLAILWMTRRVAAPLAKHLQFFKMQIEPRDVKQSIE